jgi:hypothetical protein
MISTQMQPQDVIRQIIQSKEEPTLPLGDALHVQFLNLAKAGREQEFYSLLDAGNTGQSTYVAGILTEYLDCVPVAGGAIQTACILLTFATEGQEENSPAKLPTLTLTEKQQTEIQELLGEDTLAFPRLLSQVEIHNLGWAQWLAAIRQTTSEIKLPLPEVENPAMTIDFRAVLLARKLKHPADNIQIKEDAVNRIGKIVGRNFPGWTVLPATRPMQPHALIVAVEAIRLAWIFA